MITDSIINRFGLLVISYLIGSISPSYLIGKYIYKIDIRKEGSGNPGSTNALRTMGKKVGAIVLLCDFLKGMIAAFIGMATFGQEFSILTGFAGILGHDFPFYLEFKGGKGVATSLGAACIMIPQMALMFGGFGLVVIFLSNMVSAGSVAGFASLAIYVTITSIMNNDFRLANIVLIAMGLLGVYKHRANIRRIMDGKENKLRK